MKGEPAQIFDWQGIRIEQDEVVHKVGTDAILLGAWVKQIVPDAFDILDAGTGTGILSLMAARHYPSARINSVDIDEKSLILASRNAAFIEGGGAVEIFYENILHPQVHPFRKYDLIISNPPFYSAHILPAADYKARARHSAGPFSDWVNGLINRVTLNGNICIIVPFESASQWITAANEKGYYNSHRLDVFSSSDDPAPKRSLLHFTSRLQSLSLMHISIYAGDNHYTTDYLNLTGIRSGI
jgi:tRNA1Val (adenine37-N6)-methyltransferase